MKSGLTESQFLTRLAMNSEPLSERIMNRYAAFTEQIGQDFQDILVGQPAFDAQTLE